VHHVGSFVWSVHHWSATGCLFTAHCRKILSEANILGKHKIQLQVHYHSTL